MRNLRDVEAESIAANDRHPVRDFYVQGVDLAEDVVDGRNHAVHRGLCQVDNGSKYVSENVHDILPRGSPVPGEYVLHKLDEVRENRFYIFDGCGYAAPPAGKVGGEQREVGLESRNQGSYGGKHRGLNRSPNLGDLGSHALRPGCYLVPVTVNRNNDCNNCASGERKACKLNGTQLKYSAQERAARGCRLKNGGQVLYGADCCGRRLESLKGRHCGKDAACKGDEQFFMLRRKLDGFFCFRENIVQNNEAFVHGVRQVWNSLVGQLFQIRQQLQAGLCQEILETVGELLNLIIQIVRLAGECFIRCAGGVVHLCRLFGVGAGLFAAKGENCGLRLHAAEQLCHCLGVAANGSHQRFKRSLEAQALDGCVCGGVAQLTKGGIHALGWRHKAGKDGLVLRGDLCGAAGHAGQGCKGAIQFFLLHAQGGGQGDDLSNGRGQFREAGLSEADGSKGQICCLLDSLCADVAIALGDGGKQVDAVRCGGVACGSGFSRCFQDGGSVVNVAKRRNDLVHTIGQVAGYNAGLVRDAQNIRRNICGSGRNFSVCAGEQGFDIGQFLFVACGGGHGYGRKGQSRRAGGCEPCGSGFSDCLCRFAEGGEVFVGCCAGLSEGAV